MSVRSTTGLTLGKVIDCGDQTFTVEKGLFFPRDHELRYDHIMGTRGDEIVYQLAEGTVTEEPVAAAPTFAAPAPKPAEPIRERIAEKVEGWRKPELADGKELKIPLLEEQLFVEKATKDRGAVRIHKEIVTEERKVTVPISHEEVVVERVPASRATETKNAHPFEDERYAIELHEEDFTVSKKPVLREEVRVRRVTKQEERVATAAVRHEEVEVEDDTRKPSGFASEGRMAGSGYDETIKKT